MLESDPLTQTFGYRILDFFADRTPWQRRLWQVGSALSLREVLECSRAVREGVLTSGSFSNLTSSLLRLLGPDPGVGDSSMKKALTDCLKSNLEFAGKDYEILVQLSQALEDNYLEQWSSFLANGGTVSAERLARSVAAHMLDLGFTPRYLHRWWTYRIKHDSDTHSLQDLIREAQSQVGEGDRNFEVLVAFVAAPTGSSWLAGEWLGPSRVAKWLNDKGGGSSGVRQNGGILLSVRARDEWGAAENAAEVARRIGARVAVGSISQLESAGVWVAHSRHPHTLDHPSRMVEIHAIDREGQLYLPGDSPIDESFELLEALQIGAPAPAAAAGWAAVESLLMGPGEKLSRAAAADRLATIVACSLPRAELTALAYAHEAASDDEIANRIRGCTTNLDRANVALDALSSGAVLVSRRASDSSAQVRMERMLTNVSDYLWDAREYLRACVTRLYRLRNLVMHWGRTRSVVAEACLRTTAPIVGAGMDRITHAWFREELSPVQLAARAELNLRLLGGGSPPRVTELLEPSKPI